MSLAGDNLDMESHGRDRDLLLNGEMYRVISDAHDMSAHENAPLAVRRSGRVSRPTDKGREFKIEGLSRRFWEGHSALLDLVTGAEAALSSGNACLSELESRKMDIRPRLSALHEMVGELDELGAEDTFRRTLTEDTSLAVSVISKIVALGAGSQKPGTTSPKSRISKTAASIASARSHSSSTSRRAIAVAEAAALQSKLEAQQMETKRQSQIQALEAEAALLKGKLEEERIAAQIKAEKVRIAALDEAWDLKSESSVLGTGGLAAARTDRQVNPSSYHLSSSTAYNSPPGALASQQTRNSAQGLRIDAMEFAPANVLAYDVQPDALASTSLQRDAYGTRRQVPCHAVVNAHPSSTRQTALQQTRNSAQGLRIDAMDFAPANVLAYDVRPDALASTSLQRDAYGTRRQVPCHAAVNAHPSSTHQTALHHGVGATPPLSPQTADSQSTALIEALTQAMSLSRLPTPEPPIFTGDPLQYPDWHASFSALIEGKRISAADKIHYLRRYVGGPAREAISGFFLLRNEEAFQRAKAVLEKRFGNSFAISDAFISKLESWPKISSKDKQGLHNLSDFLQQCGAASQEIKGLSILNDIREMQKIAIKLPEWMTHRWNRIISTSKREKGRYPNFSEFSFFVAEEADIANDPALCQPPAGSTSVRQSVSKIREPGQQARTALATNIQPVIQASPKPECQFCKKDNHHLRECRTFARNTMETRREFVRRERLCFGCLNQGHRSIECKERGKCDKCNKMHPTSLHDDNVQRSLEDRKEKRNATSSRHGGSGAAAAVGGPHESAPPDRSASATCGRVLSSSKGVLTSMVVPVYLSSDTNPDKEILVYALLDTMSDSTFVLETVAEDLQTPSQNATLRLTTLTDDSVSVSSKRYSTLRVRGFRSGRKISLPTTYSRDQIPVDPSHIPTPETAHQWPHLNSLASLLTPKQDCPIGLLIGYNCSRALAPLNYVGGKNGQPFAIETELGWSIVGGLDTSMEAFDSIGSSHRVVTREVIHTDQPAECVSYVYKTQVKEATTTDLVHLMERDFRDDDSSKMSQEDFRFLRIVKEEIHQREDGYYEMPLPFKAQEPKLPNNRQAALHRVLALAKQFSRRPQYLEHYTTFMKEVMEQGYAERIPAEELNSEHQWYIPHHGVYHPKKPDKVRVVFDCSARYRGTCLNDHLLQGPDLVNPLVGVLCRFRKGPIAFTCDIEKMYHQFKVDKRHQDFLRFLWWEGGDLSKPPVDYRMKVHIFGATSSPGCANFGLKQIAQDHNYLGKDAAEFLRRNFYVDDGLRGETTAETAKEVLSNAREICAKGNLRLHKIASNSQAVIDSVPVSERASSPRTEIDEESNGTPIERALGLQWCVATDTFCFKLHLKDHPLTRRGLLATVASVYDPLGLIAPVVLGGRQILQVACKEGLGWDQQISQELRPQWKNWTQELQQLAEVQIPRCYQPKDFGTPIKVELHHFSDASLTGYGQCSYLRLKNTEGLTHCVLVMAKARVAPLSATTVPRLELQAATLSVKSATFLDKELDFPGIDHFFWTDSKVVLGYIKNESKRFHMFVANRVQQIRKTSEPDQWNYVSTAENPADHASRGLTTNEFMSSNWFSGPSFLWGKEVVAKEVICEVSSEDVEVKSTTHRVQGSTTSSFEEKVSRFSSYKKALTAVGVIVKCCAHRKGKSLTDVEARQIAEKNLIRAIQKEAYPSATQLASKNNPLRDLDPFTDSENLLRVGGRLRRAQEAYGVKHPVILPKTSHLSVLIARHHHERMAHQGRNATINEIRTKGFWIVSCRKIVSSLIHKCQMCIRMRGKPKGQRMADLPEERTEPSPPFTYCGLDCFGPFLVKEGRREVKRYGLIFTCLALRAIHVEVVDDLSADSFLNGLRCFIALRGGVRVIRCDRGTNFVGACHELKEGLKKMDQESIATRLIEMDCEFRFNPPSASHMGGVWERQIRSVRSVLGAILGQSGARLDTSSLRTLMYEVTAIVNSRPLTTETLETAEGPLPLTPNHLLTMKSGIIMPPPGNFVREDLYLKRRWRRVQYLVDVFWTRWKKEYLHTLQARGKWQRQQRNLRVGDIVLLQEDGACRADWRMARVEEVFPGDDGLVRKAKILLATADINKFGKPTQKRTFLERPVHKLLTLLPVD